MTDIITAYQEIPEERRHIAAEELHEQVCADAQRAASAMLDFCRSLKTMRDTRLYTELGCTSFDDYVERKIGLKRRQVYNYIQTYERLGSTVLQSNAQLGITKLQLLCEISAPDIPAFLEENNLAGMTVAEIKRMIVDREGQAEQISLLQEQVRNLESRPVDVAVAEPDVKTLHRIRKEIRDEFIAIYREKDEKRREEYDRITSELRQQLREANENLEAAESQRLKSESENYEKAEKEKAELLDSIKKAEDARRTAEEKLSEEKARQDKKTEKLRIEAKQKIEEAKKEEAEKIKAELAAALDKAEKDKTAAIEEAKKMAERMNKTADADLITANFHLGNIKESLHNLSECIRKIRAQDPQKAKNVAVAVKKILNIAVSKMEDE